jgi:NAD(P)-dependent dehydrogenase (short-subunit alcohol dehydrogenase family)
MEASLEEKHGSRLSRTAARLFSRLRGQRVDDRALRRRVQGRVVLVTGASYGIGEATAERLAQAGATVLLVARSADKLEQVAARIRGSGGVAQAYAADLAKPESVEQLVTRVLAEHGGVDVVVNNAGKSIRRSIALSYDRFHDFQRTIDVNYLGPVKLLLSLLPSMRARGRGHIVNVSTVGTRVPPAPRWSAYQASKSAFDVFLRSAALEARADGIHVTSIYMSLVHTRMSAPTPVLRRLPGLSPAQAAELVATAIVERPKSMAPWWLAPAEVAADLARGPLDTALGLIYRLTEDSASAQKTARTQPEQSP